MAMLHAGKAYSVLWRIVWNRNFRRMTVSDVASEILLVSERTLSATIRGTISANWKRVSVCEKERY